MKQLINAFAILAAATAFAACNNDALESSADTKTSVRFTVSAAAPQITKVTFDSEKLVWEGNESIGLLIGNDASNTADPASRSTQELVTLEGTSGIFGGEVTLGDFTTADIQGIVYPYSQKHYYRKNGTSQRIVMTVAVDEQIQKQNNVLNGANAPLFCPLSYSDIIAKNNEYTIEGKQFQWGCTLVRFNIYGNNSQMAADEVFKSITLHSAAGTAIAGTSEWKVDANSLTFNGNTIDPKVSLEEEVTIKDKTAEDGIKVFMALLPRGESYSFPAGSYIRITTDKAEYVMFINTTMRLVAGEVRKIGLDLSKFTINRESVPNTLPETTWAEEVEW